METSFFFFFLYAFFGFLLVSFYKVIADYLYKLILVYTDKLEVAQLFIFKVDSKNKNSLLFSTRVFTLSFGLAIAMFSAYHMYLGF